MLVVGDTRVRELEKVADSMKCDGWRVEFLWAPGAKLDRVVEMMKGWRLRRLPDQPRLIVIASVFHDLVVMNKSPDGKTFLKMADGVLGKGKYPALTGLETKIKDVEATVKKWWGMLDIIWIEPYPIDARRWTENRLKEGEVLSEDEVDQCHQLTLDLANWLDRANCIGTRIRGMGDRFVPWYVFWNDAKRDDVNFSIFKQEYKKGVKFGWINRTRTIDGFLPCVHLSKQTLKMLFRKARQAVPSPDSLRVSAPVARIEEPTSRCLEMPESTMPHDLNKMSHDLNKIEKTVSLPASEEAGSLMKRFSEVDDTF